MESPTWTTDVRGKRRQLMDDELAMTALHEAAHAVVSASLGQQVSSLSIIPTPPDGIYPGTLGHVCLWPQPRPRASDMHPRSTWVEHACMVDLAGYVIEGAQSQWLVPPVPPGKTTWDHQQMTSVLRCVSGHDPDGWLDHAPALQAKVARFMSVPVVYGRILQTAQLLLQRQRLTAAEFYQLVLDGKCGVLHPTRSSARCYLDLNKHPVHTFPTYDDTGREVGAEGLNPLGVIIGQRERARDVSPGLKRLREVNEGGPGYVLSRPWQARAVRLSSLAPDDIDTLAGLRVCNAMKDLMNRD